jgi:uncharacterized membrane protein
MRKYFITGALIVLPVIITILVFLWLFRLLDGIFGKLINKYLMANFGFAIPGLGIIFGVILIFLVGILAKHLIDRRILSFFESWFIRFPIIKQIYPAVKQIINFLFTDTNISFKKTVLIEYPRKGIYALGFITNEGFKDFNQKTNKELVNVLIPSIPNPLTGYLALVPKEEIIFVDISVEDALKMIISGGVVNPSQAKG